MLSVRPSSCRSSGGYSLMNCQLYSCIPSRGKGALGPLSSALAGARKRETPSSNVTENAVDNTLTTFKMNVTSCGNIYWNRSKLKCWNRASQVMMFLRFCQMALERSKFIKCLVSLSALSLTASMLMIMPFKSIIQEQLSECKFTELDISLSQNFERLNWAFT